VKKWLDLDLLWNYFSEGNFLNLVHAWWTKWSMEFVDWVYTALIGISW
jgi:hypothetical protein